MYDLEPLHYLIAIVGAFVAGSINTLSGSGSAITLGILMEVIGLPGNMANGTNRVGILFQCAASSFAFHKNGKLNFNSKSWSIMIPIIVGAIVGVMIAINISNEEFKSFFKYIMLLVLIVVLVKPKRWLIEKSSTDKLNWYMYPLLFALGMYGGFINVGFGIFFLILTVLVAKLNLIESNAIKNMVVFLYSIIVLAIFHYQGMVDWKVGAVMALGQGIGGYVTGEIASRFKGMEVWAYRLLVVMVIFIIIKSFGILNLG